MRKLIVLGMAVALCGSAMGISPSESQLTDSAEINVFVNVAPTCAVAVSKSLVDLGSWGYGTHKATVTFRIDTNVQTVKLQVIATHLYKGDFADSPHKIPVADGGAGVQPARGNAVGGGPEGLGNFLPWMSTTSLNGMDARESKEWPFESGDRGVFSQDVDVTIEYDMNDHELPQGQYSGWIKLICSIDP
jgi:hypothetical protein